MGVKTDKYWIQLPYYSDDYFVKLDKYYRSAGFKFTPPNTMFYNLDNINTIVYLKNTRG